jgi:hypothetical protein
MRPFAFFVLGVAISAPTQAQKDKFPLTANVVSPSVQTVPNAGGVANAKIPLGLREQFPNAPGAAHGALNRSRT